MVRKVFCIVSRKAAFVSAYVQYFLSSHHALLISAALFSLQSCELLGVPKAGSFPGARNPVLCVSPSETQRSPDHSVALCWTSAYFCPSCTDSPKPEWWVEQYNCSSWPKACIPPLNATKHDDFAARVCIWIIFSLLSTKILRFSLAGLLPS